MTPLSVTINGLTVQAEPEMTVLEAARAHGIYIPTLCYSPNLRPAGACRMCVVKIENMRGFPTSCTTLVADGMVVHTETTDLQKLRREVLALILSEHPYTCLVCQSGCGDFQSTVRKAAVTTGCQYCPANGQCELQELVDYLDLQDIPYPITYRGLPVEQDDPFFDRDYNLCILCGRCVRTCQEERLAGVLAFVKRGADTIVGTAFGRSHLEMGCQFCGACVDVCPTGALADKRGKWEGVPSSTVRSVCAYCSVGCAIDIQVKNDSKVIRALGNTNGPANAGRLCVRGRFGIVDVVHSLNRLKAPMVRQGGRLIEVSWEDALGVVAENLSRYRLTSPWEGDGRFALVASASATNEEGYALQKFGRAVMNTNHIVLSAGFPEVDNVGELAGTLKSNAGVTIHDLRDAACIIAVGTNTLESHPVLGLEILHALKRDSANATDVGASTQKTSLITVDARQTRLARESDVWLQPRIATDHVLVAGIIKALADTGAINPESSLSDLAMDTVTAITGVAQQDIVAAAHLLAQHLATSQEEALSPRGGQKGDKAPGPNVVVIYGSGVTHHPTATQVITALRTLAYLVNQSRGARRIGIMGVPGEGNFVGAHDQGVHPVLLPGYRPVSDPEARSIFEAAWNTTLNPKPGQSYRAIRDGVRTGQIQALYLVGDASPLPEFSNLGFLVVQDIVASEVMQYADVVLPATTFAEMDGTFTNLEGRVQRLRQAISPVGASRPGWMIARDLARTMGNRSWSYESAAEVMDEIAALVPAYAGVSYAGLSDEGIVRRFEPAGEKAPSVTLEFEAVPRYADDEFPLTLITERNLFYYQGACLTEQVPGMNLIKQEEILFLNPTDTSRLGVSDGDLVRVVSPYGSSEHIVRVADGLMPEGVAFASFNRAGSSLLFPTLSPESKALSIRVELES